MARLGLVVVLMACSPLACSKHKSSGGGSGARGAAAVAATSAPAPGASAPAPGASGLSDGEKALVKAYLSDGGDEDHGDPNAPFNQTKERKKLAGRCRKACAHVKSFEKPSDEFGMGAMTDNGAILRDDCVKSCLGNDYKDNEIACVAKAKNKTELKRCQLEAALD